MNLCAAVVVRKPAEIRALLAAGADANAATRGRLPLVVAAGLGKTEIVTLLLEAGADPNGRDRDGATALAAAAREGRDAVVALLLERGAEVGSALIEAVQGLTSGHLASVRRLLAAGARADVDPPGGRQSLLMLASAMSSPAVIEALLEAGADPNAVRPAGTALMRAVRADRPGNVEVLLRHGADPTRSVDGETPLDVAQSARATALVALLTGARPRSPRWALPELWARIRSHLDRLPPERRPGLRPGASARDIERLEEALGRRLPEDLRESFLQHDGQLPGVDLVPEQGEPLGAHALLTLDEVAEAWRDWTELAAAGEFADLGVGAAPGVREAWWWPGWIPFARTRHGDLLCVDVDPVEGTAGGRVIVVGHESPARDVVADSFHAWLEALEERLGDDRA